MSAGRAETMKLIRKLRKQGFTCEQTGGKHWKVSHPDHPEFTIMSFSPKSTSFPKTMKRLRAMGFKEGKHA